MRNIFVVIRYLKNASSSPGLGFKLGATDEEKFCTELGIPMLVRTIATERLGEYALISRPQHQTEEPCHRLESCGIFFYYFVDIGHEMVVKENL